MTEQPTPQNASRFSGKIVCVTGAGSGIGAATATAFATEGATVLVADIHAGRGEKVVADLLARGLKAQFVQHDAGDDESWDGVRETLVALGGLDVLVNNAYSGIAANIEMLTPAVLHRCNRVNVDGTLIGIRMATDLMQRGGAIVNLSSIAAFDATTDNMGYSLAKHSVIKLTEAAAVALGQRPGPIRVNAVAPGYIDTPALEATFRVLNGVTEANEMASQYGEVARSIPLRRIGVPEEIASGILFLASDEARYITGQCVRIDGGKSLA